MPAYTGTYYVKKFTIKNSTGPINLTGWTFESKIRDRNDTAVLLDLTTANGGWVVTDGPNGKLELRITAAQTAAFPVPSKLIFDVLRTDISPGPVYVFGARFSVKQPSTR
jgi:hypothetical protein